MAWTFNIRGADVSHTPLPLSYALVPKDGRPDHLHRPSQALQLRARPSRAIRRCRGAGRADAEARPSWRKRGASIALDSATAADALSRLIAAAGGKAVRGNDPVSLLKAVKNTTEIEGTRTAHQRDAVALARFLAWVDREAPSGALTEIDAVEALETFRRQTGALKDVSFPDHLRHRAERRHRALPRHPQEQPAHRARRSAADRFRRAVSGRHHRRHPHHRDRRADARRCATALPACCAAISRSRARYSPTAPPARSSTPLRGNSCGRPALDFEHGTGHGVGSYLSVHEGPARISKLGTTPLKRGMILSNEPGYYKTDAYGIRIENLELVVGADIEGAEKPMNAFETLTLAPIDRRLIDVDMLSAAELNWLNDYHARVATKVRPQLDDNATQLWLDAATAELK